MGEILGELLPLIAELLLEVIIEAVGEALLDVALRAIAEVFKPFRIANPLLASVGYALLGAMAGGVSLVFFPHPLVHPSKFHGLSLFLSPVITGFVMSLIGSILRVRGKEPIPLESFHYGFAFAFGMALIRYFFVG